MSNKPNVKLIPAKGFSLVELAIALSIIGLLAVGLANLTPNIQQYFAGKDDQQKLTDTQAAIDGFLLANYRLPCPDTNNDGLEDCGSAGALNASGTIPYKTLKLAYPVINAFRQDIAYSVYRNSNATAASDADLAALKNRFELLLPASTPAPPANMENVTSGLLASVTPIDALISAASSLIPSDAGTIPTLSSTLASIDNLYLPTTPAASTTIAASNQQNGLDFCWALKNASKATESSSYSYVGPTATPNNQAYILASPGASNASNDANGSYFDGANNDTDTLGFELPSKKASSSYDDMVMSVGFEELAGRLSCPTILAKVNGAVRAAYAMHDAKRMMTYTYEFRYLALTVQQGNLDQAIFNLSLASADTVIYIAQNVIAIAAGAESFGAAVATIAIPALAAGALTAKGLFDAITGLIDAEEARNTAIEQVREARAEWIAIDALYTEKLNLAKELDAKGWYQ